MSKRPKRTEKTLGHFLSLLDIVTHISAAANLLFAAEVNSFLEVDIIHQTTENLLLFVSLYLLRKEANTGEWFPIADRFKVIAFTFSGFWQSRRNRIDLLITSLGIIWSSCISSSPFHLLQDFAFVVSRTSSATSSSFFDFLRLQVRQFNYRQKGKMGKGK